MTDGPMLTCSSLTWGVIVAVSGRKLLREVKIMRIEVEQEEDGRWIAEVIELAGVMTYGTTKEEAIRKVKALALRVLADRLDNRGYPSELANLFEVSA